MIEIRSFAGDADELAQFTKRVWRQTYEGKMLTPQWSKEHFERDLLADGRDRDLLVAAYDGTRLVGSHPAKSISVRLHGETRRATWASYLSVDPEYRRHGVALKLQMEYVRRHRERDLPMNFGYLYERSPASLGPEFWRRLPGGVKLIAKVGLWVRPLDHKAVAHFELHRPEAWYAQFIGHFQGVPDGIFAAEGGGGGIRPYKPGDLAQCVALLNQAGARADLAYLWDTEAAALHFSFPKLSRSLVFEREGRIQGLITYTFLDVLGRAPLCLARIDALALEPLAPLERLRFIRAALRCMYDDGAQAVAMLRGSWQYAATLFAAGFLPLPPEFDYVAMTTRENLPLDDVARLQVMWL